MGQTDLNKDHEPRRRPYVRSKWKAETNSIVQEDLKDTRPEYPAWMDPAKTGDTPRGGLVFPKNAPIENSEDE